MRKSLILTLLVALCVSLAACDFDDSTRAKGEKTQESIMKRATAAVPVPQVNNFLTRQSVAKWMRRMDKPNKIFYVYIMADTGNPVGYYTAQNRPVSTCTLLTPPDREVHVAGQGANPLGTAPALDGVYYGSSTCAGVFFFDAETDAYIEISGFHYFVTDQPLRLKAKPIQVAAEKQ